MMVHDDHKGMETFGQEGPLSSLLETATGLYSRFVELGSDPIEARTRTVTELMQAYIGLTLLQAELVTEEAVRLFKAKAAN